jgi:hypothetical protein
VGLRVDVLSNGLLHLIWIGYGHQNVRNCCVGFIIFVTSHNKVLKIVA